MRADTSHPESVVEMAADFENKTPASEIRNAFERFGYVLVRNAIPVSFLRPIATEIKVFLHMAGATSDEFGLSWAGTYGLSIDRRKLENGPTVSAVAADLENQSCHAISRLGRRLLGPEAKTARRVHVYCSFPDDPKFASPPHQDTYGHTAPSCRVWIPITPVAYKNGGLIVAPGSHKIPRRVPRQLTAYAVRPLTNRHIPNNPLGLEWATSSDWSTARFSVGDVVVMHPDLIHAALPVQPPGIRIAIAVDVFVNETERNSELAWEQVSTGDVDD